MNNQLTRRFPLSAMIAIAVLTITAGCNLETVEAIETTKSQSDDAQKVGSGETAEAILAGGCFWCTEAVFERMKGVSDVESGYIGGSVENPTYAQVCTGLTGHAEAVRISYDPAIVGYDELLKVFFKTHDPTTLNRQGVDTGTQYRSAIYPVSDDQKQIAKDTIKKLDESGEFRSSIVTSIEPASTWYPAEEYHQDYFRRNPNAGYCQQVVAQKVRKFNREFGKEYLQK